MRRARLDATLPRLVAPFPIPSLIPSPIPSPIPSNPLSPLSSSLTLASLVFQTDGQCYSEEAVGGGELGG